jgi:hypothetical protein
MLASVAAVGAITLANPSVHSSDARESRRLRLEGSGAVEIAHVVAGISGARDLFEAPPPEVGIWQPAAPGGPPESLARVFVMPGDARAEVSARLDSLGAAGSRWLTLPIDHGYLRVPALATRGSAFVVVKAMTSERVTLVMVGRT